MTARLNAGWPILICTLALLPALYVRAETPATVGTLKKGETAKDTDLQPLEGKKIKLSDLTKEGPVVLVVLRGFPGYQCPVCTQQVGEFHKAAKEFEDLGAKVVLIYPGPAQLLEYRAGEFVRGEELPKPLMLVTDHDYAVTKFYGLRWEASGETAYPATFVLDKDRVVKFLKVSKTHGDRAKLADVLTAVRELKGEKKNEKK